MLSNKWLQGICLALICGLSAQAKAADKLVALPIDYIVAIVNEDVITHSELLNKVTAITGQLKKQGTPLPEPAILEKQVLERMITDQLQQQFARESGLRVDDVQLDKAMLRIAQQNKFQSIDEFRARLEKDGIDFKKFREIYKKMKFLAKIKSFCKKK